MYPLSTVFKLLIEEIVVVIWLLTPVWVVVDNPFQAVIIASKPELT
jgi:hypothetical protein